LTEKTQVFTELETTSAIATGHLTNHFNFSDSSLSTWYFGLCQGGCAVTLLSETTHVLATEEKVLNNWNTCTYFFNELW